MLQVSLQQVKLASQAKLVTVVRGIKMFRLFSCYICQVLCLCCAVSGNKRKMIITVAVAAPVLGGFIWFVLRKIRQRGKQTIALEKFGTKLSKVLVVNMLLLGKYYSTWTQKERMIYSFMTSKYLLQILLFSVTWKFYIAYHGNDLLPILKCHE